MESTIYLHQKVIQASKARYHRSLAKDFYEGGKD